MASLSRGEGRDERCLLGGFDGRRAIAGADPGDCAGGVAARQDGEASEGSTCAAVATDAADLDALALTGPAEHVVQRTAEVVRTARHAEVGPVDVRMRPRWLPAPVEVEPEAGNLLPIVRAVLDERRGDHRRAIEELHAGAMAVHLVPLVMMSRVGAARIRVERPHDATLSACDDDLDVGHDEMVGVPIASESREVPPDSGISGTSLPSTGVAEKPRAACIPQRRLCGRL